MKCRARWYVAAVVVSTFLLNPLGGAQERTSPTTASETTDSGRSLREQTIYIPYENLRKTFEKEGRGVFLPYEKFRKLWDAARAAEIRPRHEESRRGRSDHGNQQ